MIDTIAAVAMQITTIAAAPVAPCPEMTFNGTVTTEQRAILQSAYSDACTVLASSAFRQSILKQDIRRECRPFVFFARKRIASSKVLQLLDTQLPSFTLKTGDFSNGKVTAEANAASASITIANRWVNRANDSRSDARGQLINTIAHELTHLIPVSKSNSASRFRDRGQSMPWCSRNQLVSYAVGNSAEAIWRAQKGL